MPQYVLIARIIPKIGWRNIVWVIFHRLKLAVGWRPQPTKIECPIGPVFSVAKCVDPIPPKTLLLFGWHSIELTSAPDWHSNPIDCSERLDSDCDWVLALQSIKGQDVKHYWELSRFYWLPQFAHASQHGDADATCRIELWLRGWIEANPPYLGINWACGQEASIRLMNLALTAIILDIWRDPPPALKWLVETHARRIRPTLSYALGQDNNHGTAEACGLFIAGSWGRLWSMPGSAKIEETGRSWLNDRALRTVQSDGSPIQYSCTYHRANLEVLCMSGLWSAITGTQGLRQDAEERVSKGAHWLHAIVDPATGDVPNLGANDGSHLFCLSETEYRDFRPTVALAAALFDNARPWPDYDDSRLAALSISRGKKLWKTPSSSSSDVGGFHILRQGCTLAMMHYPRFRFRPCQSDLLHVDFWHNGVNLLRDAGTFSYHRDESEWFASTAAHNTVEFDGRDQMPRLGKFLYGDWLNSDSVALVRLETNAHSAMAAYTDAQGARHQRVITLSANSLVCEDRISGSFQSACLRWRLAPDDWQLAGNSFRNGSCAISIEIDGMSMMPTLGCSFESRYYQKKTKIPMLSVNVDRPATLITRVIF